MLSYRGDGSENVTQKLDSYCFKLFRSHSILFNLSGKCWPFFLDSNSERLCLGSEKEKVTSFSRVHVLLKT